MTEIEALRMELELTRATHLSVVRTLQAQIDKLTEELAKEVKWTASLSMAATERAEADARAYNCGEL